MAVLKLVKSYGSNVAGEMAGFDEATAEKLLAKGIAIHVTAAPVEAVTKDVVFAEAEEVAEEKGLFKKSKKKG